LAGVQGARRIQLKGLSCNYNLKGLRTFTWKLRPESGLDCLIRAIFARHRIVTYSPCRNVKGFRGGLVFKAQRLVYHSTLGLTVIQKKKKKDRNVSALQAYKEQDGEAFWETKQRSEPIIRGVGFSIAVFLGNTGKIWS